MDGKPRLLAHFYEEVRLKHCHVGTVQKLLGHKDVSTAMIHTHVLN